MKTKTTRLTLNPLEAREVLASFQVEQFGSILRVSGSPGSDQVVIRQIGNQIAVDGSGHFWSDRQGGLVDRVPASVITHVIVNTQGRDDTVRFADIGPEMVNKAVLILGGDGNDNLTGCPAAFNLIDGEGGDDTIRGSRVEEMGRPLPAGWVVPNGDFLVGGSGNDTITGGGGNDELHGDAAINFSFALSGTPIGKTVDGGYAGNDLLTATGGADKLFGNSGSDRLRMTVSSRATIDGGLGDDHYEVIAGTCRVTDSAGMNEVVVLGTEQAETLRLAGTVSNLTALGSGIDLIASGIQRVQVLGLGGDDLIDGTGLLFGVSIDGGVGNDSITGGASNDTLMGGIGNDVMQGGAGNDTLLGGFGNDVMQGGVGNDDVSGNAGDDTIDGGAGNDLLDGGNENDTIDGGLDNDTIKGGAGDDMLNGSSATVAATAADGIGILDGGEGNDTLNGGTGDDILHGGSGIGADVLDGGTGNDTLRGGDGDDMLFGGTGDDALFGGADNDSLEGGLGHNLIDQGTANENGFDSYNTEYGAIDFEANTWEIDGAVATDVKLASAATPTWFTAALQAATGRRNLANGIRYVGDGVYEVALFIPGTGGAASQTVIQRVEFFGVIYSTDLKQTTPGEFWGVLYNRAMMQQSGLNWRVAADAAKFAGTAATALTALTGFAAAAVPDATAASLRTMLPQGKAVVATVKATDFATGLTANASYAVAAVAANGTVTLRNTLGGSINLSWVDFTRSLSGLTAC